MKTNFLRICELHLSGKLSDTEYGVICDYLTSLDDFMLIGERYNLSTEEVYGILSKNL